MDRGIFFSSLNRVMTDMRMTLESVSLQLSQVGCEVEQASPGKAMYGARDSHRNLDSHIWPEGDRE